VSREDLDHATSSLRVAEAQVELARANAAAAKAQVGPQPLEQHPSLLVARTRVRESYLNLQRCRVLAPVTGIVGNRQVDVGQTINPNMVLMEVIPLDSIWVDANFLERQLRAIRVGQPVQLTSDMYGGCVEYQGCVVGLAPGSGAVFSLLPPQNAIGNWIKVVQRVPVRIRFMEPDKLRQHPLVLGLSMHAHVDLHDTSGPQLPTSTCRAPVLKTTVFDLPMCQIEQRMDQIVQANLQQTK
jgi:membrane fusion protein, multidrug efflux system